MGGAENFTASADLGQRITRGLRERSREHYECDLCARGYGTESGLWAHTKDSHSDVFPDDEYDQEQLRARKREMCRKLSDTSARHHEQLPPPPSQLSAPLRWRVSNLAEPRAGKQDSGDLGVPWGVGNSDVHDIEMGTSHITLSNARKRNGPDSPAEYPVILTPLNVSRDDQSPKRSRPQSAAPPARRTLVPARGGLSSAFKRLSGTAHFDPDFDRSRYQADPTPTEEGARPVLARRLYDPDSDIPGAPKVDEDFSSKRIDESTAVAHRAYSRTKREARKRGGLTTGHGQRFSQLKPATPLPQQPPASREGGQMMILKLGGQYSQPPQQQPQAYPGKGEDICMVPQPETRPISPEQLIAEVKGIYAGLVMVEAKCQEVDAKQTAACHDGYQPKLNNEQWQALIALHRTLLHEHHDFFLASQHPSASPSLRRLAPKYSMPARMWKHGIYSFLELLRYRLPHSREHMLTFIYIAYSMMALLYETVSAFEVTWVECLGDLGRYRMGIEDNDDYHREVWASVSGSWYSKAADKTPHVGRLYHHLAILAEPNVLDQLFYYCKSLGVTSPFHPARESILTLFDPIFSTDNAAPQNALVETDFIQLHGINFTHIGLERFNETLSDYLDVLDKHIGNPHSEWKVPGCYMAVCNIVGLYQYGAKDNILWLAWREGRSKQNPEEEMEDAPPASQRGDADTGADFDALLPPIPSGASSEHVTSLLPPRSKLRGGKFYESTSHLKSDASTGVDPKSWNSATSSLEYSKRLAYEILGVALERTGDSNVLPHIHVWLVFLAYITRSTPAMLLLENEFPWGGLVYMLNSLVAKYECDRFEDDEFPVPEKGIWRPLPEDYTLRGLDWAKRYFPDSWFQRAQVGDEERSMEPPSMENIRIERILWLATRIAANGEWLCYSSRRFEVHPALLHRIQEHQKQETLVAQELEASRMTPTLDDSDIEMASGGNDSDGDYVLVSESEEVRRLKQKQLQLQSQLRSQSQLNSVGMSLENAEEAKQTIAKGPEALRPGYTVLVVDTNLLLSHPDAFELMSTNSWPVVIPNTVITELLGLTNKLDSVGDAAKRAMISITDAVTEKRDVKVVTAKGNNVTNIGFYKEQLDKQGDEEFRNLDDIIIGTAKQQGEARRQAIPGNFGDSEPSVLVTEDRNMRVKANARGVTAIAASVLKRTLARHAERPNSVRLKRKSFVPPAPGPQEPAKDEVSVFPGSNSVPSNSISSHELLSHYQMAGGRRKRLHKRGRTEGADTNASGIS